MYRLNRPAKVLAFALFLQFQIVACRSNAAKSETADEQSLSTGKAAAINNFLNKNRSDLQKWQAQDGESYIVSDQKAKMILAELSGIIGIIEPDDLDLVTSSWGERGSALFGNKLIIQSKKNKNAIYVLSDLGLKKILIPFQKTTEGQEPQFSLGLVWFTQTTLFFLIYDHGRSAEPYRLFENGNEVSISLNESSTSVRGIGNRIIAFKNSAGTMMKIIDPRRDQPGKPQLVNVASGQSEPIVATMLEGAYFK